MFNRRTLIVIVAIFLYVLVYTMFIADTDVSDGSTITGRQIIIGGGNGSSGSGIYGWGNGTHTACLNGTCLRVSGSGWNRCPTIGAAC